MSLFLPQSRHISEIKGKPSEGFPTQATIQVKFEPADAFGVRDAENRTTFPANAQFSLFVDLNRGTMQLGGQSYIDLVRASHDVDGLKIELTGNEASISFEAESLEAAQLLALSLNDFMPAYLSLHLSVYVRIVSLILLIGDAEMRLTVKSADTPLFNVTDAERTINNAVAAFTDWRKVGDSWVRFALAAYYFRHALRLSGLAGDGVVAVAAHKRNLSDPQISPWLGPHSLQIRLSLSPHYFQTGPHSVQRAHKHRCEPTFAANNPTIYSSMVLPHVGPWRR